MKARTARRTFEVLAFVLPVLALVFLSYERAIHDQRTRASLLADEVLRRAEITSKQLADGFMAVRGVTPGTVCSDSNIIRMRKIAVASPYLGGFGYIENNKLLCSSFGSQPYALDVGPPNYISATGYAIRLPRELDIAPGVKMLLTSAPDGFTGFFHPTLVLTLVPDGEDISLGAVGTSTRLTLMSTGSASFDWKHMAIPPHNDGVILANGYLLAIRKSPTWDNFSYAAVPLSAVFAEFGSGLPVALFIGVGFGIAGVWLARRLLAQRASLHTMLRVALRRNEIYVEYQPIVDMRTGRWVGAEVLARWRMDNGELVSPDVFISLAEEHGIISEITALVVALGVGHIAPLLRTQPGMFLTINCSPSDLEGDSLFDLLTDTVKRFDLSPSHLHVEITERNSVSSTEQVANIEKLRAHGFEVGTDDFGVGFSNLGYLNFIPLDYVKIDRSLLIDRLHDDKPFDIVETIVRLAHARSIRIIAEGVETETQRVRLTASGVDFGQGWLFARPMSALEFLGRYAREGGGKESHDAHAGSLMAPRRISA
jgi:sensor c-di-GMP phosphodiesterase-like protein